MGISSAFSRRKHMRLRPGVGGGVRVSMEERMSEFDGDWTDCILNLIDYGWKWKSSAK